MSITGSNRCARLAQRGVSNQPAVGMATAFRYLRSAGVGLARRTIIRPYFGTMATTATAAGMGIGEGISGELGAWSLKIHLSPCSVLLTPCLSLQADAEAEDLGVVGVGLGNWECEVERNRRGSHRRHRDSQAQAGGYSEIVERDVLVDRAEIDESHAVDHIVGGKRE